LKKPKLTTPVNPVWSVFSLKIAFISKFIVPYIFILYFGGNFHCYFFVFNYFSFFY